MTPSATIQTPQKVGVTKMVFTASRISQAMPAVEKAIRPMKAKAVA